MSVVFALIVPKGNLIPIILSSPHSGTAFPAGTETHVVPRLVETTPDTDWFVDKLYDFATDLGVTIIRAKNSRYVIDLNRDPKGAALYADGREETELVPTKTFGGEAIYHGVKPSAADIQERLTQYYWPYYREIERVIKSLQSKYAHVLFYDAHSIKRLVPSIRSEPFPDLILGNQNGKTAAASVIEAAVGELRRSSYQVRHNDPFKGGHLPR